jgi:hypothetical protein
VAGDRSHVVTYQAFQESSRPGDDDEELLHQLFDEVHLLAVRALRGLQRERDETQTH